MDSDIWTPRLAAAKRQYILQQHLRQSSHLDRLNIDEFDAEDEVRPDFPCPYCYDEFDIASLCTHLEDEHSCDPRATLCPVCSIKVTSDLISHLTIQHANLFKLQRRRRLRRIAIPSSQTLSFLGRDLREAHLQVLLSGNGYRSSNSNVSNNAAAAANDPLLSSLILNFSSEETDEISKSVLVSSEDSAAKVTDPTHMWNSSYDPSLSVEERQKRIQQATGRAGFMQDMLFSTLLVE